MGVVHLCGLRHCFGEGWAKEACLLDEIKQA